MLVDGFTVDAYSTDTYGRSVAEVMAKDGKSLNVASAKTPTCRKPAAPAKLVEQPAKSAAPKAKPKPKPKKNCAAGYSPCLPVVADLNCPDIGHPVTVTGSDPYGLDRDGDGVGCD